MYCLTCPQSYLRLPPVAPGSQAPGVSGDAGKARRERLFWSTSENRPPRRCRGRSTLQVERRCAHRSASGSHSGSQRSLDGGGKCASCSWGTWRMSWTSDDGAGAAVALLASGSRRKISSQSSLPEECLSKCESWRLRLGLLLVFGAPHVLGFQPRSASGCLACSASEFTHSPWRSSLSRFANFIFERTVLLIRPLAGSGRLELPRNSNEHSLG